MKQHKKANLQSLPQYLKYKIYTGWTTQNLPSQQVLSFRFIKSPLFLFQHIHYQLQLFGMYFSLASLWYLFLLSFNCIPAIAPSVFSLAQSNPLPNTLWESTEFCSLKDLLCMLSQLFFNCVIPSQLFDCSNFPYL